MKYACVGSEFIGDYFRLKCLHLYKVIYGSCDQVHVDGVILILAKFLHNGISHFDTELL